jgi:hypothetical protein
MSEKMPTSFKDGEFGFVPSVMLGGPIDGKRYKLPILPNGGIPHGFGHPLEQPHETSPVAYYDRAGDDTVGGFYVFFYRGTREPGGKRVLAETPVIQDRTCAGFGPSPVENA